MTRVALAPCSPFSVTKDLMIRSAELAESLDVRLHTHFAENAEDDDFSIATFGCRPFEYLKEVGWLSDRTWVAHCVMPNHDEIQALGAAGIGAAHCQAATSFLRQESRQLLNCAKPEYMWVSVLTVLPVQTLPVCG